MAAVVNPDDKPRRGRPPKAIVDVRGRAVNIRITEAEHAGIMRRLAEHVHMWDEELTLSDWIREAIRSALQK